MQKVERFPKRIYKKKSSGEHIYHGGTSVYWFSRASQTWGKDSNRYFTIASTLAALDLWEIIGVSNGN